ARPRRPRPPARDARHAPLRPGRRQPPPEAGRLRVPLHVRRSGGELRSRLPPAEDRGREPARVQVRARGGDLLPALPRRGQHHRVIRTDVGEGVAVVTLDDPARRNALSVEMVNEIVAAFERLEADEQVGAVVVTGAPPAFCAGADLSHLGKGPEAGGLRSVYEGFLRVGRSTLPTLAAV